MHPGFSYEKNYKSDIKAAWLGFMVALGTWFLGGSCSLIWVIVKGAGVYQFNMYFYLLGILGVLVGGIAAGMKSVGRGWIYGLWVGLMLGTLGVIVNLELVPELYSWVAVARQLFVWALWGITGGYIGTHLRGSRVQEMHSSSEKQYKKGSTGH